MKKILLSALLLSSGIAFASPINSDTEFYCKTTKGKQVSVEFDGISFLYRFGSNLNKPELVLTGQENNLEISRELFAYAGEDRITFNKGAYKYTVLSGDNAKYGSYGGIEVTKNNKNIANIECDPETIFVNTEGKIREIIQRQSN